MPARKRPSDKVLQQYHAKCVSYVMTRDQVAKACGINASGVSKAWRRLGLPSVNVARAEYIAKLIPQILEDTPDARDCEICAALRGRGISLQEYSVARHRQRLGIKTSFQRRVKAVQEISMAYPDFTSAEVHCVLEAEGYTATLIQVDSIRDKLRQGLL